jgi:nucleotide-binding universal stress UspA family protein
MTSPTAGIPPHSVVVGVDGSDSSAEALRWAVRQSGLTGQELHAVVSWDYPVDFAAGGFAEFDPEANARDVLATAVADALDPVDAERVHQHVVAGHPARVLLDAAADADLLVVGSRGHGGFAGMLLGSVSQHVVAHATCPVLVVHGHAA